MLYVFSFGDTKYFVHMEIDIIKFVLIHTMVLISSW